MRHEHKYVGYVISQLPTQENSSLSQGIDVKNYTCLKIQLFLAEFSNKKVFLKYYLREYLGIYNGYSSL